MLRTDAAQLDLFHVADVVLFPLDRRADIYRSLTSEMLSIDLKSDRNAVWRARMDDLGNRLRLLGLEEWQIGVELHALRTKVGCEMRRRVHLEILRGEVAR